MENIHSHVRVVDAFLGSHGENFGSLGERLLVMVHRKKTIAQVGCHVASAC